MLSGNSNRQIAARVKEPLSTVQRRTKQLIDSGIIKLKYEIDYSKFGFKKGLLHIYLGDGNAAEIVEKLTDHINVLSASIHIGNSDIVAEYVCQDSAELMNLMTLVKHMPQVQKVVWSEEVSFKAANKMLIPNFEKKGQVAR